MNKEVFFALVRNVVQTAAVGTTVWGYSVTGSDSQQIAGLAVLALTILWSIFQKKGW